MLLSSIFVASVIPRGTQLPAWGIVAHATTYLAKLWGPAGYYFIAFVGLITLWARN